MKQRGKVWYGSREASSHPGAARCGRSARIHQRVCEAIEIQNLPRVAAERQVAVLQAELLTDVLIIIAVVGLVLAFVISYVTKGPEAELSLEGVDMAEYSEQIDALGADL